MADRLIEVINACVARRNISVDSDMPFIDLITMRDLSTNDIEVIRNFQEAMRNELGIELIVVGGGHGCSKISIAINNQDVDPYKILNYLMSLDYFREQASKAGFCSACLKNNCVNFGTGEVIRGSIPGTALGLLLFISYSPRDNSHRVELEKHLTGLQKKGWVSIWNRREIKAGSDYSKEIDIKIKEAKIIILLISADFLHSDYCDGYEMKTALNLHDNKHAQVIPIIVRSVDWYGSEFSKLEALPKNRKAIASWKNKDEAWTEVAIEIRAVVQDILKREVTPPSIDRKVG